MSREVDVKALISHIVLGDGADRCRICMGDTTEGQVYLGDTVMMDGDRPVTLSELLELITGVEVSMDEDLPGGLCSSCTETALSSATFRNFCLQSLEHWHMAIQHLDTLHTFNNFDVKKSLYAVIKVQDNQINLAGIGVEDDQFYEEHHSSLSYDTDQNASTKANANKSAPTYDKNFPINEEAAQTDDETAQSDEEFFLNIKNNVKKENTEQMDLMKARNEIFECPDCNKSFLSPKALYDHLKYSTEKKSACYICAAVMSQEDLVKHLKIVHRTKLYSCKKCPTLLRNAKQLLTHVVKAHRAGNYFCGECGCSFKSKPALHGHVNLHLTKNCPSCEKLFRNRKCYTIHVKECCNLDMAREDTYHTKSKVLFEVENVKNNKTLKVGARGSADKQCICDYCGKIYAGKKFVSAHIQIVHMKNTHTPCPYCGKSYAAAHMTEHIKRHEKVQNFTCEHCGSSLKTKLGYSQHLRLHTGEKPYKCKYCPATFSASSRRSEHIRKSHKAPNEILLKHCCNLCSAKFRLPYRLKHHIDTVHTNKIDNIKEFECPDCLIKFSSYRGLLYHRKKHQTSNIKSIEKEEISQ